MAVQVREEDLKDFFNTAVEVAVAAGKVIREAFHKEKSVDTKMSHADLVTETDQAVEKMVMQIIKEKYPSHKFIGEETTVDGAPCDFTSDPTWIVDPVDGTTNFVHTIPEVSFSMGLTINKEVEIGVVYVPVLDLMYTARRGHGAHCNGEKLSVSVVEDLKQAVVICEGGNSRDPVVVKSKMANIHNIVTSSRGIRAYGSAAHNLCKVASGCGEAYVEYGIHCWDIAAGILIATEAGAVVFDPTGEKLDLMKRRVLCASSEKIAKQLSLILTHLDLGRD